MGNSLSYNINNPDDNNESFLKTIDEIASNYIFKQNVVDMLRFSDSKYRENFVILTCHILNKKLSNIDIDALKERVLNSNQNGKNTNYGEIVYFSELEKIKPRLSDENDKKKALLIISKFYVKLLTLFSSIVSVIDPQYIYKDENGEDNYFNLKDFNDLKMIDATTSKLKVYHLENPLTLVKRRLFILKNKMEQQDDNSDYIVLNPGEELCTMNIPETDDGIFKLSNEIGIKELDNLYYDLYDEETNKWSGRSKDMEEQYKKDVTMFYQIFTGKKKKPAKVASFEDIELLDFHNLQRCKNNDYFEDLLVSKNDILFQKYLTKIEEIQQGTRSYKKQLLYILKSMFVKKESQSDEEGDEYVIHSELNMKTLLEKQKQIKNCIVQMYSSCEKNFIEALLLYEKMYENQYGELVNSQVNNIGFHEMNKNNANAKKVSNYQNDNNMILNGNLLLKNKIKMPNINNNNAFKMSNQSTVKPASEPDIQVPMQLPLPPQQSEVVSPVPSQSPLQPQQSEVASPVPAQSPLQPQQSEAANPVSAQSPLSFSNDLPSLVEDSISITPTPNLNSITEPSPLPSIPHTDIDNTTEKKEEEIKENNTQTENSEVENANMEKESSNVPKISLNVNSINDLNSKTKKEMNSFTEQGEKAQKSFINSLSNFFS